MSSAQSPEELQAFSREHLLYEVGMLALLTRRLLRALAHDTQAGKRDLDWLDFESRNAQVESFAVHARVLLDFFYPPASPREDDALAEHFIDGTWKPPEITPALSALKKRVGKELAHLTYDRLKVTEEAKHWHYAVIWADFGHVVRAFAEQASRDRLPEDVRRAMRELYPEPRASSVPALIESAASTTSSMTMMISFPEEEEGR